MIILEEKLFHSHDFPKRLVRKTSKLIMFTSQENGRPLNMYRIEKQDRKALNEPLIIEIK